MPCPLVVLNSHPIQYFAPLYEYCTRHGLDIEVWYCSQGTVSEEDKDFGQSVKWDIPLLSGYRHKFFRNYSWSPSPQKGFFGLINLGLVAAILKQKRSVIVVHGWNYFSSVLVLFLGWLTGHRVCMRAETPLNQEKRKGYVKRFLRRLLLQGVIFRIIHRALYIGTENKKFYEYYQVPKRKLLFAPYAVDNERFRNEAVSLLPDKEKIKAGFGIPVEHLVILFAGKYIHKKRPLVLLEAFKQLQGCNVSLVLVGDGPLMPRLRSFIDDNELKNVVLTGFVNQSEISRWYCIADIFVMCSGDGETWGLSINEAMNFSVPLIVSDRVGSAGDLVNIGGNGFLFRLDDSDDLVKKLEIICSMPDDQRRKMGENSLEIVNDFCYKEIFKAFKKLTA